MNSRALRADILLLITAGLWGFGFVAQSSGMDYVGPFTYNGLRFPLGSLSLLPFIFLLKKKNKKTENQADLSSTVKVHSETNRTNQMRLLQNFSFETAPNKKRMFCRTEVRAHRAKNCKRLCKTNRVLQQAQIYMTFLAGTVLFIAVALQQIGIIFTTVGNAGFITGFYVVLTPVFGIFIKKKTGIPTWIGMVFALAGLYFIFMAGNTASVNPGDLIIVASAVFWAVHILLIDHLVHRIDPLVLSIGQFAWCGFYSIIAACTVEPLVGSWAAAIAPDFALQQWQSLPQLAGLIAAGSAGTLLFDAAIPVLYGGLASVGIAYTLQVVAQRDAPPAHATIILCLEGTFAAMGGIVLKDEKPGSFTLLGFACMLLAMFITQWDVIKPGRRSRLIS